MRLLTALFFIVAIAPALAQGPTANTTATDDDALLDQLFASSPGKIFALPTGSITATSVATDAPIQAVYGDLGSGSLANAEDTAKTFVRTYGRLLGFPDGEPLVDPVRKFREWPPAGQSDDAGKFIQYTSYRNGAPYLNALTTFCFKPDGKLVAVVGRHQPLEGAEDVNAAATPEEAVQVATQLIEQRFPESRGRVTGNGEVAEYFIRTPDMRLRRIFSVHLTVGDPPMPKNVIVGGPVPLVEDARQTENSAYVFEWDPGTDYSYVERDLKDLVYPGFWPNWTVNGTHFKVDPRISPWVERASDWNGWFTDLPREPRTPNAKFAELHVYYHLTQAREKAIAYGAEKDLAKHPVLYFNHWVIPDCSMFDANSQQERLCEQTQTNNAWFSPSDTTLNFASRNPKFFGRTPAYDATAIYHEYAHFLHKMASIHWMQGAISISHLLGAKMMDEGFADLFAASVTGRTKVGWVLTRVRENETATSGADRSRNLERLKTLTEAATEEYHDASTCFSAACWKLKTDGILGGDAMIRTVILAMRLSNLPCDPTNVPMAVLAADQMLASTPHTRQIASRFRAQELMTPLLPAAGN